MQTNDINYVFSTKFSCPHCGYSISELEPRLFSFNSPVGACGACDGLGAREFFDPEKSQKEKSIPNGIKMIRYGKEILGRSINVLNNPCKT